MKKITKMAMACMLSVLTVLSVGCGEKKGHEHNWSEEWTYDATGHWHACDKCDEKKDSVNHTGGEATCTGKAVCEACGAAYGEGPIHSYEWKFDEAKHWQECSLCQDKVEGSEGTHTGGVTDCAEKATCEICSQTYYAAHDFEEVAGIGEQKALACKVCEKEVDEMYDLADMFQEAKRLVGKGETTYKRILNGKLSSEESAEYEYGNGYFHMKNKYEDIYYMLKDNGDPYSVRIYMDENKPVIMENNYEYSADNVEGFYFNKEIYDSMIDFYGAENLVAYLLEEAEYSGNDDYEYSFKLEAGKIVASFSFGYYDKADKYFFKLFVDFTLGTGDFLESVTVDSYQYTKMQFEEDENGNAVPTEEVPYYHYKIELTQALRESEEGRENPYDPKKVLLTSFDLVDKDGNVISDGGEITLEANAKQNRYYIKNLAPSTTIPSLNPFLTTISDYDGEHELDFFDNRLMVNYVTSGNGDSYINVNVNQQIGRFELTFYLGDATKTVIYNIVPSTPTSIRANVFNGTTYSQQSTASTYAGMNLQFHAVANAAYADPSFTAKMIGENAADASLVWDETLGDYIFSSAKIGEYTVELVSTRKDTVKATLKITVQELPDVASILSGVYEYRMNDSLEYTVTFTPNLTAEGICGSLEVTWQGQGTVVYDYAYDPANGLVLTRTGGAAELTQKVIINADFSLSIERNGNVYRLTKVEA